MTAAANRPARSKSTAPAKHSAPARSGPSAAAQEAASAEASAEKAKQVVFGYTRDNSVVLFINQSDNPKAPIVGGTINDEKVSFFVRTPNDPAKRAFMSIVNAAGDQIGTANVRFSADSGVPSVKASVHGKEIWISVRRHVTADMLATMGGDISRLNVPKAKAAPAPAEAPAKRSEELATSGAYNSDWDDEIPF